MSLSTKVDALAARVALAVKTLRDDPRWTDSRTPVAHASSHAANGSDAITPTEIGAAADTAVVHNTGTETINGTKIFGTPPQVPVGSLLTHPVRRDDDRLSDDRAPRADLANIPGGWVQLDSGALVPAALLPPSDVESVNGRAGQVTGLAEDSDVVHLAGDETVIGRKQFQSNTDFLAFAYVSNSSGQASGILRRDTIEALIAAAVAARVPVGPLFQAVQTAAQTGMTANNWSPARFPVEQIDTHGGHVSGSGTTNSRFTIPAGWGGYYVMSGVGTPGGSGLGGVGLAKNGARLQGASNVQSAGTILAPTFEVACNPGDYLEMFIYSTAGTTYNQPDNATTFRVAFDRPL